MGGKIDTYLDCNSPYSYFALVYLLRQRAALKQHGVDVEFHPVFLGGIMQGSGNNPPWKLPNKAKYSSFDNKRAQEYFGVSVSMPPFFPIMSLLAMRSMIYIKENHPQDKFETAFADLWERMWKQHWDLSKPEKMVELLTPIVGEGEAKKAVESASTPEIKQKLNAVTKMVVDTGAFGCPWFLVTNDKGEREPFFGSDRWHYMWTFLNVPYQDIAIKPKSSL